MGLNSGFKGVNVAVPALKVIHVEDVQKVQQHQKCMCVLLALLVCCNPRAACLRQKRYFVFLFSAEIMHHSV